MLIDVFPFSDEVDLAELRINYLSDLVDFFIVSEYNMGFSGIIKDFSFPRVLNKLPASISSKVLYVPQTQEEVLSSFFSNDHFQKDSLAQIVRRHCKSSDLMLFGDLDEFPDKNALRKIVSNSSIPSFCHFAQSNFMGYLNVLEVSSLIRSYAGEFEGVRRPKWLGTILTRVSTLSEFTMTELRNPERKYESVRIPNGGWHFSFCGGERLTFAERFSKKLLLSAHQEFNRKDKLENASEILLKGSDPLGRLFTKNIGPVRITQRPKFKILRGLEHLPGELSRFCRYEHLIAHS